VFQVALPSWSLAGTIVSKKCPFYKLYYFLKAGKIVFCRKLLYAQAPAWAKNNQQLETYYEPKTKTHHSLCYKSSNRRIGLKIKSSESLILPFQL
jgi:hypothetical protein